MKRILVALGVVFSISACKGHASVTGPSTARSSEASASAAATITLLSARTGQPVAGGSVTVDGFSGHYVSTSDGVVQMAGIPAGQRITIEAEGYLHSAVTKYQSGMLEYLIPDDQQQPYSVMRAMLYDNDQHGMRRIPSTIRTVTIFPDETFQTERAAVEALQWAIDAHNRANAQIMSVSRPGVEPPPDFVIALPGQTTAEYGITIAFDPNNAAWSQPGYENAGALTYPNIKSDTMVGARIIFRYLEDVFWGEHLRRALAHEIAHGRGLGHMPQGVYGILGAGDHFDGFAFVEVANMTVQEIRPAGTLAVDDSSRVSTKSTFNSGEPVCVLPIPR